MVEEWMISDDPKKTNTKKVGHRIVRPFVRSSVCTYLFWSDVLVQMYIHHRKSGYRSRERRTYRRARRTQTQTQKKEPNETQKVSP